MRKPNRTRAGPRTLSQSERNTLASRACYAGSCEHKDKKWWGGLPCAGARRGKLTTICPLTTAAEQRKATGWVQHAIGAGQYKFVCGDRDFPKHVWYKEQSGQVWYGRCRNPASGEYKGWPIGEEERREIFG